MSVGARVAAPRVKVGADVLPWWPVGGVYLTLEQGTASAQRLLDVEGVAGVWTATSLAVGASLASAAPGQTISYYFLDDDRSEEHTSELQSIMRISYAVFGL